MSGLVANFEYLQKNEHKIKALVITHGHEDHIGGISHLLRKVKIPKIYASMLPSKLIERKISEHKDITLPEIIVYGDDTSFKTKYFTIDFCRVCHSIPDSFMVAVNTPNGDMVSTGDFRFDFATNGDETDLKKLMEISKREIDVLLCESTSSEVPGFSESERYIVNNLRTMIINSPGRVLISTFASNLGRVEEIIALSVTLGRKVAILGKSMESNIKISRKIGYLKVSENDIINPKEISNFNDEQILIILTGSQGEPTAALNMMAKNEHSKVTLKPKDTIILSSNPIPGNYANVENLINALYKQGVRVIENRSECKIHSSGHATRSEQQLMIRAVNPEYIFPIHGEYKMLRALQKNAIDLGFDKKKVLITVNGNKLQLLDGILSYTDINIPAEPMYIDGKSASSTSNIIISERSVLSSDGIIQLTLRISEDNKKLLVNPVLSTRGCFFNKTSNNILTKVSYGILDITNEYLKKADGNIDEKELYNILKINIESQIWKWKKKKPYINITFFYENKAEVEELQRREMKYFESILNDNDDELVD